MDLLFPYKSSFSSTFCIKPSGLFPTKINPEAWILQTVARLLGWTIIPIARLLPTQYNTTTVEMQRHPCLEWDLNP
jgi:hypothetical protein